MNNRDFNLITAFICFVGLAVVLHGCSCTTSILKRLDAIEAKIDSARR